MGLSLTTLDRCLLKRKAAFPARCSPVCLPSGDALRPLTLSITNPQKDGCFVCVILLLLFPSAVSHVPGMQLCTKTKQYISQIRLAVVMYY